jgi:hypothetical protein
MIGAHLCAQGSDIKEFRVWMMLSLFAQSVGFVYASLSVVVPG